MVVDLFIRSSAAYTYNGGPDRRISIHEDSEVITGDNNPIDTAPRPLAFGIKEIKTKLIWPFQESKYPPFRIANWRSMRNPFFVIRLA